MARSIRVEVYLDRDTLDAIDDLTDNRSEWIRDAVKDKLEVANEG